MVSQALFDKQTFIHRRGYLCECGCGKLGHDAHHALIHNIKTKGRTKYPQLNDPRNLALVNHAEHINRKFDNRYWREYFWRLNCERYGEEKMMEWVDSLPEKIKPRMDFIERIRNEQNAIPT
mgnify:FL=1